jgi:hypothetical protein
MLDKLKADFDGIMELVNKTPAPLQETAFKMILEQWFSANTAPKPVPPANACATPTRRSGSTRWCSGWRQAIPHGQRHHDGNP